MELIFAFILGCFVSTGFLFALALCLSEPKDPFENWEDLDLR